MFESAEAGHTVDRKRFREEEASLRNELLLAQNALRSEAAFPVIVLVSGVDGAGKSETIAQLYEWMDPRFLNTVAFGEADQEAAGMPAMWRYWQALPPRGRIGIFSGSWYSTPIARRVAGKLKLSKLDTELERIKRFEAMLVTEGALILKLWFHLSREGQARRFRRLEKDPRTAWRITKETWARTKTWDTLQDVAGHVLRVSNTAAAPWIIVDGSDDNYRNLCVGRALRDALRQRSKGDTPPLAAVAAPLQPAIDSRNVLSALDLSLSLSEKKYELELARWQGRLAELMRHNKFAKRSLVLVFEGMDAAGKGGAIRRVSAALDPRQFRIVPIAAPDEAERAKPYLWRFWRQLPRPGRVTIFDRSWYGRVLVERIEGFCDEADWLRAYAEINDFEHELVDAGMIVLKFWLQIDKAEQLRRFKERENIPWKQFKITPEDLRNRKKWAQYQQAAVDMIDRTSTGNAPWIPVEANDKNHARVKILREVCRRLEHALDMK